MVRKKDTVDYLNRIGENVNHLNGRIFKKLGHVKLSPLSRLLYKVMDKNGKSVKMFDPSFEIVEFEMMETRVITVKELFHGNRS